jgi:hypothetical protein
LREIEGVADVLRSAPIADEIIEAIRQAELSGMFDTTCQVRWTIAHRRRPSTIFLWPRVSGAAREANHVHRRPDEHRRRRNEHRLVIGPSNRLPSANVALMKGLLIQAVDESSGGRIAVLLPRKLGNCSTAIALSIRRLPTATLRRSDRHQLRRRSITERQAC